MWDAGQLVRGSVVRFLRARNQQGYDIYLLPYAEQCNAGYILIDLDHATADFLPRMRANGLVVNIIILWNTLYINAALERVLSRAMIHKACVKLQLSRAMVFRLLARYRKTAGLALCFCILADESVEVEGSERNRSKSLLGRYGSSI